MAEQSSKASITIATALIGILATAVGILLEGRAARLAEAQKFESQLITDYALAAPTREDIADRLLFLVRTGMLTHLSEDSLLAAARAPSTLPAGYVQGRADGQAMRQLLLRIGEFRRQQGSLPATLDDLAQVGEIEPIVEQLGATRLSYRLDPERGFVLQFAARDGQAREYDASELRY